MMITDYAYDMTKDFEKVINFLRKTYNETKFLFNLSPTGFENDKENYVEGIHIWEITNDSTTEIAGVTIPERKNVFFIQNCPKYSFLIDEMIEWIVRHIESVKENENEPFNLSIICLEGYKKLEIALKKQGFEKGENYGYLRIRDLNHPIHKYKLPDGFKFRTIKGPEEYSLYARAIRDTFGHGEYFDGKFVGKINSNSYYRKELDFIIEAPNGDIACFCTFRMDKKSGLTELEPLGTVPKYRKLGLAQAILGEGYKILNEFSPSLLFIGGAADTPGANKLYDNTGFTKKYKMNIWKKKL